MSLGIIYKVRTVPTEGGHPRTAGTVQAGPADTSTPLPCPSAQYAPPKGAAEYYTRSQALGPGLFLCSVRDVSNTLPGNHRAAR
jgi:hypothetical protein